MSRSDESRRKDRLSSGARSDAFSALAPDPVVWPFQLVLLALKETGKVIRSILGGI